MTNVTRTSTHTQNLFYRWEDEVKHKDLDDKLYHALAQHYFVTKYFHKSPIPIEPSNKTSNNIVGVEIVINEHVSIGAKIMDDIISSIHTVLYHNGKLATSNSLNYKYNDSPVFNSIHMLAAHLVWLKSVVDTKLIEDLIYVAV